MAEKNMSAGSAPEAGKFRRGGPERDISAKSGRKKSSGRLKKYNTMMLRISVALLVIFSAALLGRIQSLNRSIESLSAQARRMAQVAAERQEKLQLVTEELENALQEGRDTQRDEKPAGEGVVREEQEDDEGESIPEITAAHKVYLTFDDGPGTSTEEILEILDRYDVKATFFVVGKEGEAAEESMRQIVEAGHTLGMHSYSHKYGELYASVENFAEDLKKQQDYIYEVTGVKSTVYRFPGGSSNTVSKIDMGEFARYLDREGVRFFDWNISSGDGGSYLFPADTIIENCTANISKYQTSIVLMHDTEAKTTTREALPVIIEKIQAMEDTVILPITEETVPVQHIDWQGADE